MLCLLMCELNLHWQPRVGTPFCGGAGLLHGRRQVHCLFVWWCVVVAAVCGRIRNALYVR